MMHAQTCEPGAPLWPHVLEIWRLRGAGQTPAARPERLLPHGCIEIVLSFASAGACQAVDGCAWTALPTRLVAGPLDRVRLLRHGDATDSVGIRLRPGGAAALLGLPAEALAGILAPLDQVMPALDRTLAAWMEACAEGRAGIGALERALLQHLAHERPALRGDALVTRAAAAMLASGGALRVGEMAGAAGLGARQLDRRFRRAVGLPPRRFGRIVRFARAWQALAAAPPRRWADAAADLGYADQPHLIREFRALAGTTPTRLFGAEWYERTTWTVGALGVP